MSAKPKIAPAASGAPRWTYAVGAIVGVIALVWAIISFFIPKPEPPKPPVVAAPAPAPSPPATSVTVEGTGNVGIGTMSGGSINVGAPPKADAPAAPPGAASKPKQ